MFIGHYGVAFAIKKKRPDLSIGLLFIAVQWVDILFCSFVLLDIEKLRIVPGFTAYNPYDLFFMPYTHSLLGSFLWAIAFGGLAALFLVLRKTERLKSFATLSLWLALATFSHFLLDLPMHVRDLPLTFHSDVKLGLGLWNYRGLSLLAEVAAFLFGLAVLRPTAGTGFWIFVASSLALLIATPFMPVPDGPVAFAWSALVAYFVLAAVVQLVMPKLAPGQ